ncbi:MAG: Carbohydrate acetyl esterase/feruloyl esterase precursor [Verrucomicrobiota bacterium]|jgi:hypothetical protein
MIALPASIVTRPRRRRLACRAFVLAAVFAIGATANVQAAAALPARENFHLFLLAGQSNMAGRGPLDDAARTPSARVFSLNQAGQWQPAVDPLHWDKTVAGVGVGRSFAEVVATKNPGISIGLIPAACGGSPLSAWAPGQYFEPTKSHPYDDAIARAKRALQDGTLKGILWHQGESDATAKDAPLYGQRLEALITQLRQELNAPNLPVIIGQVGRFSAAPWTPERQAVDAAQQAVAKKMKNVRFVSAEGLTANADNIHFATASLRTFGQRYAAAFLELTDAAKTKATAP